MTSIQEPALSRIWELTGLTAKLTTHQLSSSVDLQKPEHGLCHTQIEGMAIDGFVLGVAYEEPAQTGEASNAGAFVRGRDLIANYAEAGEQPWSWQVYWRVVQQNAQAIVIDAIISVQTQLLECFPRLIVQSQLTSSDVWLVNGKGDQPECLTVATSEQNHTEWNDSPACIVFRASDATWSYAEMAHPDDHAQWAIHRHNAEQQRTHWQLGGEFLEKGVICRSRIRGAFLPREGDLQLAAEHFQAFCTEKPPLTA